MIEPIGLDALGYVFAFSFSEDARFGYILSGATCVFDALRELRYSGRCECYSAEMFALGRNFAVGLMLRPSNRQAEPTSGFWRSLYRETERNAAAHEPRIKLLPDSSELDTKRSMVATLLPCGIAEYQEGVTVRILGKDGQSDSFFEKYFQEPADAVGPVNTSTG
jgi:hypothetical protein